MSEHRITLDVFRVVILAPADLTQAEQDAMHRPLDRVAFRRRLRRAAARLCRRFPELARAAVRVAR